MFRICLLAQKWGQKNSLFHLSAPNLSAFAAVGFEPRIPFGPSGRRHCISASRSCALFLRFAPGFQVFSRFGPLYAQGGVGFRRRWEDFVQQPVPCRGMFLLAPPIVVHQLFHIREKGSGDWFNHRGRGAD